jgi:lysophospholipase L1-like esterase
MILERFLLSLPLQAALWLLSATTLPAADALAPDAQALLQDVRRIVFLGDSITQKGDYVADVECWLLGRGVDVEVLNLGLGSETATDLTPQENEGHLKKHGFGRPCVSERLGRVLAETKPDLLFACYGMNDAALPPGEAGLRRFAEAVTRLRDQALASGVKHVVLCTPPVHDNKSDAASDPSDQQLARYSEWLVGKRNDGWSVVDIHTPMRTALDAARQSNPAFLFAEDGVHPNREGHWLMAREILRQAFGEKPSDLYCSEQLFPFLGAEIRDLVRQRQIVLFNAWMTQIGHTRPNVPGGPQAKPGPAMAEAQKSTATLSDQLRKKLTLVVPRTP